MTMSTTTTPALRTPAGLRAWRLERGLTQTDLAGLLEVRHQTVWRWEHAEVPISRVVELALERLDQTL